MKKDKEELRDKAGELAGKRKELEVYLGELAKKLFLMLESNLLHSADLLLIVNRERS